MILNKIKIIDLLGDMYREETGNDPYNGCQIDEAFEAWLLNKKYLIKSNAKIIGTVR